jgi:L-ascorbate metabolism protein UlaG (beta-lactamase superfamily)
MLRGPVQQLLRALVVVALVVTTAGAPSPAYAEDRVPIAAFTPLPANPAVTPAARAARDRLLGDRWDDPRYVTLHWVGVSSMVVTIHGHLLLFDAWQIIGAVDDYLPLTRDDLAALDPEAILVGHGHFDHAGDLGFVAGKSGAVVVGSEEICTVAVEGATREGAGTAFRCAITGTMTSPAMGVTQRLKLFADLAPVSVLQHIHSAATPPGNGNDPDPFFPIMDPQPYIDHFNSDPDELARFLAQQQESNQGGTWIYHLVDGDFTLLIGDSAGPIFDKPAIRTALGRFPGCVDVMSNAILGFDQPVSGLADPVDYVDAVKPAVFLPTHADAWAPVLSAGQAQYKDKLMAELAELKHPPSVDFLLDPQDYLKQRSYLVADRRWKTPPAGSVCAAAAARPSPVPRPSGAGEPPAGGGLPSTGGGFAPLAVLLLGFALLLRRRRWAR